MPTESILTRMPEELREEFAAECARRNYSDIDGLWNWLNGMLGLLGLERVGRTAVGDASRKYKKSFEKAQLAAKASKDFRKQCQEEGIDLNAMNLQLLQVELHEILSSAEGLDVETLATLSKTVLELTKANILLKQYQEKIAAKAEEAAKAVDKMVRKAGVTDEQAEDIRKKILGISI